MGGVIVDDSFVGDTENVVAAGEEPTATVSALPESPKSSGYYVPLLIAKIVSKLLWVFGILGLSVFIIVQLFTNLGGIVGDVGALSDKVVQERLNETFPEVQIGTATDMGAVDSTKAIVDLFNENDAIDATATYWEFRNILSTNAAHFVEVVGSDVVINSPNQLGSDTIVTVSDGVEYCEIALDGKFTTTCD